MLNAKQESKTKARSLQEVMKGVAQERAEIEAQSNGLIILTALFGKKRILESIREQHSAEEFVRSVDLSRNIRANVS